MTSQKPSESGVTPLTEHFFVVRSETAGWVVSAFMARHIETALLARFRPRWVTFVDLYGSRVRVRTDHITVVEQSTTAQRAAAREFHRLLGKEHEEECDG